MCRRHDWDDHWDPRERNVAWWVVPGVVLTSGLAAWGVAWAAHRVWSWVRWSMLLAGW